MNLLIANRVVIAHHCPGLENTYLQGEETRSPMPALLSSGVWPEPAGIVYPTTRCVAVERHRASL